MIIIDPPSPFASKGDWERFLEDMLKLSKEFPEDEDVKEALSLARETLEEME